MLKKYGNYKFDLDKDCFVNNDNNERIYIKTNKITYIASFVDKDGIVALEIEDDSADNLDKQIELVADYRGSGKNLEDFKELFEKIKIRDPQNNIQEKYAPPPNLEDIKNIFDKHKKYIDSIEDGSLVGKIKKLEERVNVLEDSIEDIQRWRNS